MKYRRDTMFSDKWNFFNLKSIAKQLRWRWPDKRRDAFGLSLIFCFFCIKAKEKAKDTIGVQAQFFCVLLKY
jgi:hypothetical protein